MLFDGIFVPFFRRGSSRNRQDCNPSVCTIQQYIHLQRDHGLFHNFTTMSSSVRVSQVGGPCSLVPFQNCPMFPCSHTLSECFRTVIFRNCVPCSQKLANVPLFPSIFCQCSLVPQNPWETLLSYFSPPGKNLSLSLIPGTENATMNCFRFFIPVNSTKTKA